MKSDHRKPLTFGALVASVYSSCSRRKAKALLRFAVNQRLVFFQGQHRVVLSAQQSDGD